MRPIPGTPAKQHLLAPLAEEDRSPRSSINAGNTSSSGNSSSNSNVNTCGMPNVAAARSRLASMGAGRTGTPGHLPLQRSESYGRLYEPEFVMVCVCVCARVRACWILEPTSSSFLASVRAGPESSMIFLSSRWCQWAGTGCPATCPSSAQRAIAGCTSPSSSWCVCVCLYCTCVLIFSAAHLFHSSPHFVRTHTNSLRRLRPSWLHTVSAITPPPSFRLRISTSLLSSLRTHTRERTAVAMAQRCFD